MVARVPWTPEIDRQILALTAEGLSPKDIAQKLPIRVSRQVVSDRLYKLRRAVAKRERKAVPECVIIAFDVSGAGRVAGQFSGSNPCRVNVAPGARVYRLVPDSERETTSDSSLDDGGDDVS